MNAIIAEESVIRGWLAGFWAGAGAMLADVLFFVLVLAGVVTVIDHVPVIRPLLYLVGGVLMLYFAIGAINDARSASSFIGENNGSSKGFRKTFALSLTNPYQIGFWLTVASACSSRGRSMSLHTFPRSATRSAARWSSRRAHPR